MYELEKIGRVIAERRKKLGLTQEALATKLHISPQAVSKWETNGGYPDLSMIPALAAALDITPGALFGSETDDIKDVKIEESYEDLPLVCAKGDIALYSSKTVLRNEDGIVYFTDGSEANLFTRTVVNMGSGEIRFAEVKQVYTSDVHEFNLENRTFSDIRSVEVDMKMRCCTRLLHGNGFDTEVEAEGTQEFFKGLRIYAKGETLFIEIGNGSMEEGHSGDGDNKLTVYCGFNAGNHLKVHINGSGNMNVEPDFASGEIRVNGSGNADVGNIDRCSVLINGSGNAGIIKAEKKFDVGINGSGDVRCRSCHDANIGINGSGDVDIKKCSGSLSVNVMGSGDVSVCGEVDTLRTVIRGSGDLDASGLVVGDAEIDLSGASDATIGHILRRSVERIGKTSCFNVLKRG